MRRPRDAGGGGLLRYPRPGGASESPKLGPPRLEPERRFPAGSPLVSCPGPALPPWHKLVGASAGGIQPYSPHLARRLQAVGISHPALGGCPGQPGPSTSRAKDSLAGKKICRKNRGVFVLRKLGGRFPTQVQAKIRVPNARLQVHPAPTSHHPLQPHHHHVRPVHPKYADARVKTKKLEPPKNGHR